MFKNRWTIRQKDLPIAASLVSWPWTLEQSAIIARNSEWLYLQEDEVIARLKAVVCEVHGRIVSVRPCLKAAVLQDS